jgi:hypothetical protein
MADMERDLRNMMQRTADDLDQVQSPTRKLVRRAHLRRARTAVIAGTAFVVVLIGGFAGARSLSSDGALPPANPNESSFVDKWVNIDVDGSDQTMVIRASGEEAFEIVVRDDSAGVCLDTPSTMTGIGQLDGATELVIPDPEYTCDQGIESKVARDAPLEELLRNLTFIHDPGADTLTDSLGSVWSRETASETPPCTTPPDDPESLPSPECLRGDQIPETEVARGDYEGTPWRLDVFTEPVIGEDHAEGYHSLGLSGHWGNGRFAFVSGIRPDSALEGTVGTKLLAFKDGFPDALVISGTTTPDITRVVFSEGSQTRSAETMAVPTEVGDDFRVFVLFAPFGTDVGCLQWDIETVNCFGAAQKVVGLDAVGEVVAEEGLGPEIGRDCLVCAEDPDPDEFKTKGSEGGLKWRLSARRYGSERCFAFSLGSKTAGGRACLTRTPSGWFGEVAQRAEPQLPDVAPVYGAIPSHVDEVEVVLDNGSAVSAEIFRPENHPLAYYLAWIPDAFTSDSVRFIQDGRELGSRRLCAADHRDKNEGFVCYGTTGGE